MLSLEKSQTFQNEMKTYRELLENLSDPNLKKEVNELIRKLLWEVKNIDIQHNNMITTRKMPAFVDESKHKIQEIRSRLQKLSKDFKRS
jgi:hypothetical protein